jgi:hypothetical protein
MIEIEEVKARLSKLNDHMSEMRGYL